MSVRRTRFPCAATQLAVTARSRPTRVIATIVGDLFGLNVQAYPMYGSEKKGLPTTYFLTVADEPIGAHAELRHVDFVPLNNVNAFNLGNPLSGLVPGGTVFIQHSSREPSQIWSSIPANARKFIQTNRIRVLASGRR